MSAFQNLQGIESEKQKLTVMNIERNSPIPFYFQLAEILRAAIDFGIYPAGSKLPTEGELCARYNVSRSVVRQALLSLSQDNLIETRRGRGAFILGRKVPIAMKQKLDPLLTSMNEAGFKLTTKVTRQELIDTPPHVREQIGDNRAIMLERLRYADGIIFLVVHNYLPYSRFPDLLSCHRLEELSLYEYLAQHYNAVATTGKRQLEISRLDREDIAEKLHVDKDSYVIFNQETTYDQHKDVLEYYESWHHPDRTRLVIELERTYT